MSVFKSGLVLSTALVVVCSAVAAKAQPSTATPQSPPQPPSPSSSPTTSSSSSANPLSVPAKSSLFQRLNAASMPGEAEIRLSVGDASFFGLTRGFAVGSHLVENALSTLLGQHVYSSGTWLQYDILAGYQFLSAVDNKHFAAANVGYTSFSLRRTDSGSGEQKIGTSGFSFQINYAQVLNPVLTLGIQASGLFGKDKFSGDAEDILRQSNEGTNTRRQLTDFYEQSNSLPKVKASFPIEVEVINWKASHIDLPNHLRGYVAIEPFYRQFELKIDKAFESVEKNFGLKVGPKLTYESLSEKAGRYAMSAEFGAELSGGKLKTNFEDETNPQVELFSLKKKKILAPYLKAHISYKF